jgi:DNA-binding response OmpR family regulator
MSLTPSKPATRSSGRLRVLIVEDTPTVAAVLQAGLHQAGMDTDLAQTGAEAVERGESFRPEIVLIDLDLPDIDGLDLVRRFAVLGGIGVIVVTGNGEEATRIAGLDIGADDYVVKPVRVRELAARIRALRRRMRRPDAPRPGIVTVDHARRCLTGGTAEPTPLTEAELAALETLLDAEGASVSREWLSRVALKRPLHDDDRAVDQLILKLRRKLAKHGTSGRTILAVRHQGYVIADSTLFRSAPVPFDAG